MKVELRLVSEADAVYLRRWSEDRESLHQARHALVSYLLHKGVPVAVVQRMVGHADAAVTLGVYTHALDTGSREQVVTALAAVGL